MKKTIIASIAAFAIVSTSSANLGDVIIDSAIGGGIGAVIGNNTGDGDSETGAIIGAVSGGVAGWRNRTGGFSRGYGNNHGHYPRTMPHGRSYPTPSRVYVPATCVLTVPHYENVWSPPEYDYDFYGNRYVSKAGYYYQVKSLRTVRCNGCYKCL